VTLTQPRVSSTPGAASEPCHISYFRLADWGAINLKLGNLSSLTQLPPNVP